MRLSHAVTYSTVGQLGYVLSQMAILAALARLRGAEAVGEFGLALALTTPFFMFGNIGKTGQATDVSYRYAFSEYVGIVLVVASLGTALSIASAFALAPNEGVFYTVLIVALAKAAESISKVSYGAFQHANRIDKIVLSQLLRGGLTLPLFVILLLLGLPTAQALLAQLFVWSVIAVLWDYPLACREADGHLVWPSANPSRLLLLARETWPLGASYVVGSLLVSLPRIYVERSLGLSAAGVLTIIGYFQQAGTLIIVSISQPLVNRFARIRQRGMSGSLRRTLGTLAAFLTVCSLAGLLVVAIAGEWLLSSVFGAEFATAQPLLMLIALALSARLFGIIPQTLLHADRRFNTFLIREIASVLACLMLLALLVPQFGIMGAGYAILGTAIFRLVTMAIAVIFTKRLTRGNVAGTTFETTAAR